MLCSWWLPRWWLDGLTPERAVVTLRPTYWWEVLNLKGLS
jgi:hypothetical protein